MASGALWSEVLTRGLCCSAGPGWLQIERIGLTRLRQAYSQRLHKARNKLRDIDQPRTIISQSRSGASRSSWIITDPSRPGEILRCYGPCLFVPRIQGQGDNLESLGDNIEGQVMRRPSCPKGRPGTRVRRHCRAPPAHATSSRNR